MIFLYEKKLLLIFTKSSPKKNKIKTSHAPKTQREREREREMRSVDDINLVFWCLINYWLRSIFAPPPLYLSQETSSSLFLVQLDISDRQHPTWYTQTSLTHINILCFAYLFVSLFSKRSFSISAFLFTECWFLFIIFCYKEKSILGFRATFCTEIMGFC